MTVAAFDIAQALGVAPPPLPLSEAAQELAAALLRPDPGPQTLKPLESLRIPSGETLAPGTMAALAEGDLSYDDLAADVRLIVAPLTKVTRARPTRRSHARHNDLRLMEGLLAAVKATGWVSLGLRQLAKDAGMSRETARHALARLKADGAVEVQHWERRRGGSVKLQPGAPRRAPATDGIRLVLEHRAWSDHKLTHALERSNVSSQVRPQTDPSLSTREQGGLRPPTTDSASPLEAARLRRTGLGPTGASPIENQPVRVGGRGGGTFTSRSTSSLQVPALPPTRPTPRAALGNVGQGVSESERGLAWPKPDWVSEPLALSPAVSVPEWVREAEAERARARGGA